MEKKVERKILIVGAIILLLCVFDMPYGIYSIVRVSTTIISGYFAYNYFTSKKLELAITFSIITLLFQPLVKIHLGRDIWVVVDVLVAILFFVIARKKK